MHSDDVLQKNYLIRFVLGAVFAVTFIGSFLNEWSEFRTM